MGAIGSAANMIACVGLRLLDLIFFSLSPSCVADFHLSLPEGSRAVGHSSQEGGAGFGGEGSENGRIAAAPNRDGEGNHCRDCYLALTNKEPELPSCFQVLQREKAPGATCGHEAPQCCPESEPLSSLGHDIASEQGSSLQPQ